MGFQRIFELSRPILRASDIRWDKTVDEILVYAQKEIMYISVETSRMNHMEKKKEKNASALGFEPRHPKVLDSENKRSSPAR